MSNPEIPTFAEVHGVLPERSSRDAAVTEIVQDLLATSGAKTLLATAREHADYSDYCWLAGQSIDSIRDGQQYRADFLQVLTRSVARAWRRDEPALVRPDERLFLADGPRIELAL